MGPAANSTQEAGQFFAAAVTYSPTSGLSFYGISFRRNGYVGNRLSGVRADAPFRYAAELNTRAKPPGSPSGFFLSLPM